MPILSTDWRRLRPLTLEAPDEGAGRSDTVAWDTRGE
jgi:hypothetical protein